ncbi:DNA-protecting protein DprA [Phragmitibacter flavus]|uniref:DNA-protecting protein DprA n=1 Tax=Phragmitibacter flavus TaxID=2576071 RepID=A0A5R8KFP9_9BACT|nr:DNA-processing protein DprA [Phragmitibacter flavus]TLD71144.1 DNA-protecting protein DprA [Phragmitibacter flavus]
MTSTHARLALNLLPKIGPIRVQRLLEVFGTPEDILRAKASDIQQIDGFGNDLASTIAHWKKHIDLDRELRRIQEENLTLVTPEDSVYPDLLSEIHDPPLLLYVRGQITERDRHAVSIVGVRNATAYGLATAKKLAFQLAQAGYTIISGLARGIDTAAHEGALAAKGRTIAVIGSGHAKLYPPENAALAERIAESGAVVSEYPVDYPPDKTTFPQRNRIVSGWSSGTIVVEAALRSGSLITANQAMDQGRTVFAVPGNIDRPSSHGCNHLIQQGAKLVQDASDILEEFNVLPLNIISSADAPHGGHRPDLSEQEAVVHSALSTDELHINEIALATNLPIGTVSTTLMKLEMKSLVRALPGKFYVRLV